ncbi:MAG: hypothetical protein GY862_39700 [Gammaproteobacteria bacterium]|nr:hypothetical protein [Gammaproteobacteria bacterium]
MTGPNRLVEQFRSPFCFIHRFILFLILALPGHSADASVAKNIPEGLEAGEWRNIQQQIRAAEYHPAPAESGDYTAPNRVQGLHARFSKDGRVQVTPTATQPGLSLRLTAYGYGDELRPVPLAGKPVVKENRVEYRRGDLTEWYVNDERGMEQGFTFNKPPAGSASMASLESGAAGKPLRLSLTLDTGLIPELSADRQGMVFKIARGRAVFTYDRLHVTDARNQAVPAWFELADGSHSSGGTQARIHIAVQDAGAVYPLIIDPFLAPAENAKFNRLYADENDGFGYSVAMDGDTMAVAAFGCAAVEMACDTGAVYIFVYNGVNWNQQAILTADDTEADDLFGASVALNGDTALVGARLDDDGGVDSGSVYVFTRNGGMWALQQKLIAGDAVADDLFGISAALSGDTALVGARSDDDSGADSGSVYVFTRDGGVWTQQAKLLADDAAAEDLFGVSVALNGDTALVGAYRDDDGGSSSGSVYVFMRNGGIWTQQQKLTADDAAAGDYFGGPVALSGDTALLGAYGNDDGGAKSGSAYVFTRSGGVWTQQQKLTAADAAADDSFGGVVALNGDTALIGASKDDDGGANSGSAYVFSRNGGVWTQQAKLFADDAAAYDRFGPVALNGDTALVGALGDDDGGSKSGSAYVFARNGGEWAQLQKLTADDDATTNDLFGLVALNGDTALIGARGDDDSGVDSGSAYVFARNSGVWTRQQKLTADDASADDRFGASVALSGDTALAGAYTDDVSGSDSGSAYVFTRNGKVWTQQAKLFADDATADDRFGGSVALSGDTALIGAPQDDDGGSDSGSAYVFIRGGGVWTLQQKLTADDASGDDKFGISMALSNDTALVGASGDNEGSGAAYVFTRSGGVWTQQQKLIAADAAAYDRFGGSAALNSDTALIGTFADDDDGSNSGSAYVFIRDGGKWTLQQKLTAADAAAKDVFGWSVALNGDTALVGAGKDDDDGADSGSTYVFTRSKGVWRQQAKLFARDAAANDWFGGPVSVALSGDTALIGAVKDNDGNIDSGSAYVFTVPVFYNDAPQLDNSGDSHLDAIDEDADSAGISGTSVPGLIASATGDRITDTDSGAFALEGIAVITLSGDGAWQYSTDNGANWTNFGTVSPDNARLLASDDNTRVRFVPGPEHYNTAKDPVSLLTFRAWDQTNVCGFHNVDPADCKHNGDTDDVSVNGSDTPYSTATETASVTVNPMSDPPVLKSIGNQVVIQGQTSTFQVIVTDPKDEPAPNTMIYSLVPVLPWLSIDSADGQVKITPNNTAIPGEYSFTVSVSETDGDPLHRHSISEEISIFLLPALPSQTIPLDETFSLDFTGGYSYPGVSFTLSSGPGSITPAGVYTWTPDIADSNYNILVTAEAGGASASQTVPIEVVEWVLESTVNMPGYQLVNTVLTPILSGGGRYRNTTFNHVETAMQEAASGLYAAVDNGQFGAFSANEPAWLRAGDNLGNERGFSNTDKPFAWNLPLTATQNMNFQPDGQYRILARATDSAGHTGTQSEYIFPYNASQAAVSLSLEASSPSLLFGETEFSLTGKLTRYPLLQGLDLSGLPIVLHITRPDKPPLDLQSKTHTDTGQFRFKPADDPAFAFDEEGVYLFVADFSGMAHLEPKQSKTLTVLAGTSAGYAALVQGKITNEEGLGPHYKTASRIYKRLLKRGFEETNIAFFSDFNVSGREREANLDNIRDGLFNPQNGLQAKMNGLPAQFYFIMADHGDVTGNFQLGKELLSPAELNGLLDEFEADLNPKAKLKPRIIIVGACYSGKFIEALSQARQYDDAGNLSDGGRLIITSSAPDEVSYKGPMELDGVRSGEMFLEEFFQHLVRGDDFKTAFEKSVITVEQNTRRDDSANNAGTYRDAALQHPLLDDNGDGRGNNTLYYGGDGGHAEKLYLGAIIPKDTNYGGKSAEILDVTDTLFLDPNENQADLRITVSNAMRVNSAPVDIRVPQTELQRVVQAVTEQQEISEFKRLKKDMDCTQKTLPHECTVSLKLEELFEEGEAIVPGTYEIFHFVRDAVTYEISPLRRSLLYKNYEGNQAPKDFNLIFPGNGAEPQTVLIMDWEQSDDPDGHALTYTLTVAGDPDFIDTVYQAEELTESMAVIAADAGLKDLTTYYWKATAIDKYGARTKSPVFSFTTNNRNASPSVATIRAPTDAFTHGAPPSRVSVTPQRKGIEIRSEGETHNVKLPQQEKVYNILVEASGYKSAEVPVNARNEIVMEVNVALQPVAVNPSLSVTKHGEGTVTSSPPGIDCGTDCTEEYADMATQVTLTANPAPHHQFAGWRDDGCPGNEAVCSLMMSKFRFVGAAFEHSQYLLAVRKPDGTESVGYISGPGIDCGADCEELYPAETGITLTAQPVDPAKHRFAGWAFESSQEHCLDGNTECRFPLLQAEKVTANFKRLPDMALTLNALPSQLAPGENVRFSVVLDTKGLEVDDAEIELHFPPDFLAYQNWESAPELLPVSSSPQENPDCDPVQGCFNLQLSDSSPTPMNGVFTVPVVFTAQETGGTAEVCFTANNRFLLNGDEVSYRPFDRGCVSVTILAAPLPAAKTFLKLSADPQQLAPGENLRLFVELDTGDQKIDAAKVELRFPRQLLDYTTWSKTSEIFQVLFSPAENTGCPPEEGCFNLQLKASSFPVSGVFTGFIDFTARETGTAEICFTANNRFLLNGNDVSHKTPAQGCVSTTICPALDAAALNADWTFMNTRAAFNACVAAGGLPEAGPVEITFYQEVQISGRISADPAHAGQTGDILVAEAYSLNNQAAQVLMLDDKGKPVIWDGNPDILDWTAFRKGVSLAEKHSVLINRTPPGPGLWRIFFAYRLAGGKLIFTVEPLKITVASCPVLKAAAIDAEQRAMDTQAVFNACMAVTGSDSPPKAAGTQEFISTEIASHQEVRISGTISADPAHTGQKGDILVVDAYNTPLDNPELKIFALNDKEKSIPWDGKLSNLAVFQPAAPLAENFRFLLKRTPLNTGLWRIFLGYRLAGGEMIFTAEPLTITVNESR